MIELMGKYNIAKVFTDNIENEAISQIIELCNQEFVRGSKIRIMPDVHAGAGCTIGTTMTITDKIVPNMVGVDIGCGMEVVKISNKKVNLDELDTLIRKNIPSGFNVRGKVHKLAYKSAINIEIANLMCEKEIDLDRALLSVGTLGGGNHFIEVAKSEYDDDIYIVIHSGSRYLGKQVAEYYQKIGYEDILRERADTMALLQKRFPNEVIDLSYIPSVSKGLAYVTRDRLDDYLHDIRAVQRYATVNRWAMMSEILDGMNLKVTKRFTTIHNYIDVDSMILRKGAISAKLDERVIIPMNMRDGSLICWGKGNPDWNYSAPHGAGRLMSRSKAKEMISLEEFEESMKGIYSTCIGTSTIDESAFAYKPMEEIVSRINETVEIEKIIKPMYNFKASESKTNKK